MINKINSLVNNYHLFINLNLIKFLFFYFYIIKLFFTNPYFEVLKLFIRIIILIQLFYFGDLLLIS